MCFGETPRKRGFSFVRYSNDVRKINNLLGKKIGKLTVVKLFGRVNKRIVWNCICECGKSINVLAAHLNNKHTQSCGCYKKEINSKRLTNKPIYKSKFSPVESSARVIWRGVYKKELSFEDFFRLSQMNCYYCGAAPSNVNDLSKHVKLSKQRIEGSKFIYSGLDRIDSKKTHTVKNVVSACRWCNWAKSNRTVEEFKKWVETIYNNLNKI